MSNFRNSAISSMNTSIGNSSGDGNSQRVVKKWVIGKLQPVVIPAEEAQKNAIKTASSEPPEKKPVLTAAQKKEAIQEKKKVTKKWVIGKLQPVVVSEDEEKKKKKEKAAAAAADKEEEFKTPKQIPIQRAKSAAVQNIAAPPMMNSPVKTKSTNMITRTNGSIAGVRAPTKSYVTGGSTVNKAPSRSKSEAVAKKPSKVPSYRCLYADDSENTQEEEVVEEAFMTPRTTLNSPVKRSRAPVGTDSSSDDDDSARNMRSSMAEVPDLNSSEPEPKPEVAPKEERVVSSKNKDKKKEKKDKKKEKKEKKKQAEKVETNMIALQRKLDNLEAKERAKHDRIRAMQKQIDDIENDKQAELEAIRDDLERQKIAFDKQVWAQHVKDIEQKDKSQEIIDANRATIKEMKRSNALIRERNRELAHEIGTMKINNERLEQTNLQTEKYVKELEMHTKKLEDDQKRLQVADKAYREAVEKMQERYKEIDCHLRCEQTVKLIYTQLVGTICTMIDKCNDDDLILEVYEHSEKFMNADPNSTDEESSSTDE